MITLALLRHIDKTRLKLKKYIYICRVDEASCKCDDKMRQIIINNPIYTNWQYNRKRNLCSKLPTDSTNGQSINANSISLSVRLVGGEVVQERGRGPANWAQHLQHLHVRRDWRRQAAMRCDATRRSSCTYTNIHISCISILRFIHCILTWYSLVYSHYIHICSLLIIIHNTSHSSIVRVESVLLWIEHTKQPTCRYSLGEWRSTRFRLVPEAMRDCLDLYHLPTSRIIPVAVPECGTSGEICRNRKLLNFGRRHKSIKQESLQHCIYNGINALI